MTILTTLDLETLQPGWTPPEDKPDAFAPLPFHEPCVMVWLVVDTDATDLEAKFCLNVHAANRDGYAETDALSCLGLDLERSDRLVTWNGRGFDMPVLGLRALKHEADWSFWLGMRHRYGNYKQDLVHYDLMDQLCDQGGARAMPMDGVCQLLGFPGKGDIKGSDVAKVWPVDPERVVTYCVEDVLHTWLIYLRWINTFKANNQKSWEHLAKMFDDTLLWASGLPELEQWYGRWVASRPVIDEVPF